LQKSSAIQKISVTLLSVIMIGILLFVTSKLLNIIDITKQIGNFFKLPIQLFQSVSYPELALIGIETNMFIKNNFNNSKKGKVKICAPSTLYHTNIGDYTYIATNAYIAFTSIGKFCFIGPNLTCGRGMHPLNGISTSPMFYSVRRQNGITLSESNKIDECPEIYIGNDVFIGANVTILNGVSIGDGAVIGAGAIVSKDIPSYAIAVGSPIRVVKYRFDDETICCLKKIKWWEFDDDRLKDVERMFFDVNLFIEKYGCC